MIRNSVKQMVKVLQKNGPMTENEITKAAFDYDRNYHGTVMGKSNKKYADMLRRGLKKGLFKRIEQQMYPGGRYVYVYYVTNKTTETKIPCSTVLDNGWLNESI